MISRYVPCGPPRSGHILIYCPKHFGNADIHRRVSNETHQNRVRRHCCRAPRRVACASFEQSFGFRPACGFSQHFSTIRHTTSDRDVDARAKTRHNRDLNQPSPSLLRTWEGAGIRIWGRRWATGFLLVCTKTVSMKREWPDWTPPVEMLKRRPDLPRHMRGGIDNPLGARALYLGSSLYRIHGSNEPDTIGAAVSSGCIRMTNNDVADLYSRVKVGTKVVVLP